MCKYSLNIDTTDRWKLTLYWHYAGSHEIGIMWHIIRKFATEELMQLKWNPSSSFAPPVKPRHDLDDINTELDLIPSYVIV